ncbi:alpha-tocopherol transfer protein-like isoform X1 [Argiope bruennichi]|uniref:alpha-tocopherol transfer protein-like isoform X1 n=1 Tax=Argiope bruennichi TaxID=94029 RepID=UPI0024948D64|nr:alpha-tocopherol transfer protein-like isoform X1 [Argiope bruennichi]XP_055943724.1 alpha-tocopherol transfer protein-like isoform X1 [Argiope bruennichi]XP_055943725.1 alpha-tocopherol transfer protein-like isoform X1 [Argiope bruennichi]
MSSETPIQMKKTSSFLPYPNDHLPDYALKKAERELKETPEAKQTALAEFKKLLQENPKTKEIHFEEDFLIHYLRGTKYTIQKAANHLQNYVDFRTKHNHLFQAISEEYFLTKRFIGSCVVLPDRCPEGCVVFCIRLGKWNPREIPLDDFIKLYLLTSLQILRDPMAQINGFKTIFDMKDTNIHHLRHATLHNLYILYHLPLNCIPVRIKGLHVVNQTALVSLAWRILYPFLPEKIKKRTHFHSEPRKLLDYFPSSTLPVQYGGDLPEIDSTELTWRLNKEQRDNSMRGQPNFY